MDTSGALSTIGLLVCVGAVVVIALLAFAFRAIRGAGRGQQGGQDMWNQRGTEQPRYDSPDVESRGGFGGVPNTGVDRDTDIQTGIPARPADSGGFGRGAQSYQQDRDRDRDRDRRRRDDDDDVRSSGGFGGG